MRTELVMELRRRHRSEENNPAVGESDSSRRVDEFWRNVRPIERAVIIGPTVAGRRFVTQVNPRFCGTATCVARDLLVRCTPGQPYRVHNHAWSDLALTDQRLVSRRETLVHFRILRNARANGCTTS